MKRAAAVLALVIAASACSGGGGSAGAPGADIPGAKEFGLTEQDFVAKVEQVQTLMAECMKRAGFEYVPVDVPTIERAQASVRMDPGVPRLEYKQRYGWSVTTRFDDPVRTIGLGPNVQIIEGLSEADRVAYELTLVGENRDADFAFTLDEEDFSSTGGCTREAVAQVFTPEQLEGTYVNPKDVLVDEDPRVAAARDAWAGCMQDAGYYYTEDQDQIIEEYEERLDALTEGDDPESLTGERLVALRGLQAEEIKVALKDAECDDKYLDAVVKQVELEVFGRPVSG